MNLKLEEMDFYENNSIFRDSRSQQSSGEQSITKSPISTQKNNPQLLLSDLDNKHSDYLKSLSKLSEGNVDDIKTSFDKYLKVTANAIDDPTFLIEMKKNLKNSEKESDSLLQKRSDNETMSQHSTLSSCPEMAKKLLEKEQMKQKTGNEKKDNQKKEELLKCELQLDFFEFFKVLNKIWKSDYIHKEDVIMLPCKTILLRSVVKRKFDEELAMRFNNK